MSQHVERRATESLLRLIAESTAPAIGEEFFRSLIRHLAEALGVEYAFVAEFAGVRTRGLFLDEIGELSLPAQAKLLRALQEQEFERVGGTKTLKVDVRVIAATNRDLLEAVKTGTFRSDLYYRINASRAPQEDTA